MATKKFKCNVCGYIHEGDAAPANCPVCGVPASEFTELKPEKKGLFSDKNGNAYIIMYSTVMVVIVATLLALAALGLQKRQYENELNTGCTTHVKCLKLNKEYQVVHRGGTKGAALFML
jgi:Na+-transporting NADH:ubiquinone oxidoreductase subunit C